MYRNIFRFVVGLIAAGLACLSQSAYAALMVGDPVGADYNLTAKDAGVTVDFVAHVPDPDNNSSTIGKLTATLNHTNLNFLGFTLKQNGVATEDSTESRGLRLLLDVKDTNGMTVAWTDYHIRASDSHNPPDDSQRAHLAVAHFHNSPAGFGSTPFVIQGSSNNVKQLNYVLGMPVNPGAMFTASNILLHERTYEGFQREFRVEFVPSVPEPTSLAIFLCLSAVAGCAARFRRR